MFNRTGTVKGEHTVLFLYHGSKLPITWKVYIPPAPAPLLSGALTAYIRSHLHHRQQQQHQLEWKGFKSVNIIDIQTMIMRMMRTLIDT